MAWCPIDLTGSGLERAVVDRARAGVANNKKPSNAGDRFWDLSGGLLRCGDCGRAMHTYRRRRRSGGYLYYYRCRPATSLDVCGNRGSHRAEHLEHEAAVMFEDHLGAGKIMELFDHALEEHYRRRGLRGSPERRAALTKRLRVIAQKRRGFQEQQAEGLMTIPELRERLAELDEEREGIADELRIVEDAAEEQRDSLAARELIKALAERGQHYLAKPGERRRKEYRQLGARFEVDAAGTLTLRLSLDLDALRTEHTRRSVATLPHPHFTMRPAFAQS
jgi:site-specific DNA recombinase